MFAAATSVRSSAAELTGIPVTETPLAVRVTDLGTTEEAGLDATPALEVESVNIARSQCCTSSLSDGVGGNRGTDESVW